MLLTLLHAEFVFILSLPLELPLKVGPTGNGGCHYSSSFDAYLRTVYGPGYVD